MFLCLSVVFPEWIILATMAIECSLLKNLNQNWLPKRPDRLFHQIRHEQVGREAEARRVFEKPYVEPPEFEGLAERLGMSRPGRCNGLTAVAKRVILLSQ
jgi:hypothetical protein